jgi:hypothetical protein
MDTVNNFYDIINDLNKKPDSNNSIYDELKSKEDKYYDSINRVIDYKNKENDKSVYFEYTSIKDVLINLFLTLNIVSKELMIFNFDAFDYKIFIKIFNKGHRLIYIGIFIILISIFMLLIEVSDST